MAKNVTKLLLGSVFSLLIPEMAFAGSGHYNVELNKTKLLTLPGPASAVVIGNPKIADVSIHSANTLFVVGRGYGETNILILDAAGQKMLDADILVTQPVSKQGVRLYNAAERHSYTCAPYCLPSPTLGDETKFIAAHGNDTKPISTNTFAVSTSAEPQNEYANTVQQDR